MSGGKHVARQMAAVPSMAAHPRGRPTGTARAEGATTMCPVCMSTTAAVVAATTSGAGMLGLMAVRFRWLQRLSDRIVHETLRRKS